MKVKVTVTVKVKVRVRISLKGLLPVDKVKKRTALGGLSRMRMIVQSPPLRKVVTQALGVAQADPWTRSDPCPRSVLLPLLESRVVGCCETKRQREREREGLGLRV